MSPSRTTEPTHARLRTAIAVEAAKLQRSLALALALVAPALIAVFVFFNLLRLQSAPSWGMTLQGAAGIWAFFMLPMSVTALTALVAQTEHSVRSWDYLRALPLPRWHLYAAKAVSVLAVVAAMSFALAALTLLAIWCASWIKPAIAPTDSADIAGFLWLLTRIYFAAWLLIAVQLWMALRYASFVPALATGIGGTFFAVVATSAEIGQILPWQIPVNQLATDPARAQLALGIGLLGGVLMLALMMWRLGRREWV
jgi:ABC-2 type transport system permease protein